MQIGTAGDRTRAAGNRALAFRRKGGRFFTKPVPGFPLRYTTLYRSLKHWTLLLLISAASAPEVAYADAASLESVINSIRGWISGILVALATLYLTVGAVRYMTAGGDPRAVTQSKEAIKNALIGYLFALLAPLFVDIVRRAVGF